MPPQVSPIRYDELFRRAHENSTMPDLTRLGSLLEEAWCAAYSAGFEENREIVRFNVEGFIYLFDLVSSSAFSGPVDAADRVVAVYGLSQATGRVRDSSRQQRFLGGGISIPGKGTYDKGHFIGRSMGGGLDVNLFPQRAHLNRGQSSAGKEFRAMETYAAAHPGTFVFARPIYADVSWVPAYLEYGVLKANGTVWVEQFEN